MELRRRDGDGRKRRVGLPCIGHWCIVYCVSEYFEGELE